MAYSSLAASTRLSALATPTRRQKLRIAAGVTPLRRSPDRVGMRGSSQSLTYPSCTRRSSLRLETMVYSRFRRANSYCRGTGSGASTSSSSQS